MYILKNAFISITRNKGRNILIGIIVLVIGCATAVTLAIRNSAGSLIESYREQYEVTASIAINRENMMGNMRPIDGMEKNDRDSKREEMMNIFSNVSNITIDEIDNYGDSKYVKSYYYQITIGVNSNQIDAASMSFGGNGSMNGRGPNGKENFNNMSSGDFTLTGYSTIESINEFINGTYKIIDGEISTSLDENNCVINSELATLNDIVVGDTITFVDPDNENNTITLTVTGIYEEENNDTDNMMAMFANSVNTIITSATVVNNFSSNNTDMKKTITPTFVLTGRDVIDSFENELTDKGLSEYLSVTTNLDQVDAATSTISNVNTFALVFLIITFIIGGIVLFVINMINIRERKYEIGVLRTIGMKKSLLSLQFVSELLIVSFVALLLGAGIGAAISVPVSNHLLQNEITSSQERKNEIGANFGRGPDKMQGFDKMNGVVAVQAFDSIDAVVDIKVLLQLLGIGIALTLISSSASMISIQKFSPLTILKERS